jgi:hypothetical protein
MKQFTIIWSRRKLISHERGLAIRCTFLFLLLLVAPGLVRLGLPCLGRHVPAKLCNLARNLMDTNEALEDTEETEG